MRFAFYLRQPGSKIHEEIALAVYKGAQLCGDEVVIFRPDWVPHLVEQLIQDGDALIFWGIGGNAKVHHDAFVKAGKRTIMLDKPYTRRFNSPSRLLRVSIDNIHPTAYFQLRPRPDDRWKALKANPKPYKPHVGPILLDGASNKYCLWNDLGDWERWGQQQVDFIKQHTSAPIIYRPRPSHNPPPPVQGAELSEGPLDEDFERAMVVVSHGGNIGFDCVLAGVPHFAIANSVARSLSQTRWPQINWLKVPDEKLRQQWFNDIAYCQWNLDEFANGTAWRYVRETLDLPHKVGNEVEFNFKTEGFR